MVMRWATPCYFPESVTKILEGFGGAWALSPCQTIAGHRIEKTLMAKAPTAIDAIRRLAGPAPDDGGDADLLRRFTISRDERAFEALVRRHGPLVWGACRRRLRDLHAAEDAFQMTFLALSRHAASVRTPEALGAWLHRVAVRCASAVCEAPVIMPATIPDTPSRDPDPANQAAGRDVEQLIDSEIDSLPDRLRGTFILCEVEHKTASEAAALQQCAVGTIESRLTRARKILRARLTRKGITPPAIAGLALAGASVPSAARANAVAIALGRADVPARWVMIVDRVARTAMSTAGIGILMMGVGVSVILVGLVAQPSDESPRAAVPDPLVAEALEPVSMCSVSPVEPTEFRRNRDAFPLPPEAIARVGDPWLRHGAAPTALSFSSDGRFLAAGARDDRWVRVWDISAGRPRNHFRLAGDESLSAVALSADGRQMWMMLRTGKSASIREVDTYRAVKLRETPVADVPDAAFFANDGRTLVTASNGHFLAIETVTGRVLWKNAVRGESRKIELAVGGRFVAVTGDKPGTISIYDVNRGDLVRELHLGSDAVVELPVISANSEKLAVWQSNRSEVHVWDLATGSLLQSVETKAALHSMIVAPDGSEVVGFSQLGPTVWSTRPGEAKSRLRDAMGGQSGTFAADGKRLAIATRSGVIQLLDPGTGNAESLSPAEVLVPQPVSFTPDGSRLIVEGWMRWSEYDPGDAAATRTIDPGAVSTEPYLLSAPDRAAISPDRKRVVRCSCLDVSAREFELEVIDLESQSVVQRVPVAGRVRRPAFSPDGSTVYGICADRRVRGWSVETGKQVMQGADTAGDLVYRVIVSPNGKFVATAVNVIADVQQPRSIQVWDAKTGEQVLTADAGFGRPHIAFSPDGQKFAAAIADSPGKASTQSIRVWELPGCREVASYPGLDGQPAFSPDGRTLAVTRDDLIVLIELATGRERHAFRHHGKVMPALAWRPDGKVLAAGSAEAPVYLWDVVGSRSQDQNRLLPSLRELASDDAVAAFQAIRRMWASPQATAKILRQIVNESADQRTAVRACEALELPADPDGINLLREWADGSPASHRTREAQETLKRLSIKRT